MNRRRVGTEYERQAAEFLTGLGYRIVEMNYRGRRGEVDLIGWEEGYLVFIEVKYRRDNSCGTPLEAVHAKKQKRICRTASYFCLKHGYPDTTPCRFDVIAMTGKDEIVHIKNAFTYTV